METNTIKNIQNNLDILLEKDDIVELRIIGAQRGVMSGYFNTSKALADAAAPWSGGVPGIYVTLNKCNPEILVRSENMLRTRPPEATSDADILSRRLLLVDLDPKRPPGISSTDAEHELAIAKAWEIKEYLNKEGFPDPIIADSGNGAHLLYRIQMDNDDTSRDLIKGFLEVLDLRFSDIGVTVDTGVYKASQITKAYGTVACKGSNSKERPHRLSGFISVPESIELVSTDRIVELTRLHPEKTLVKKISGGKNVDIDAWLRKVGLSVIKKEPKYGGQLYVLKVCPFNPEEHNTACAYIIQFPDGGIMVRCFHTSCKDNGWLELRDRYEPGWRDSDGDEDSPVKQAEQIIAFCESAELFTDI